MTAQLSQRKTSLTIYSDEQSWLTARVVFEVALGCFDIALAYVRTSWCTIWFKSDCLVEDVLYLRSSRETVSQISGACLIRRRSPSAIFVDRPRDVRRG